jgi:PIN domain nuclease of toxin-antitoxin system
VVWLYAGRTSLLSKAARRSLNRDDLFISPIVILEIDLLREIGRVYQSGEQMVQDLATRIGLELSDTPLADVISAASAQSWTKDPFDRIIVGEASLRSSSLVTKDDLIHEHYDHVVW